MYAIKQLEHGPTFKIVKDGFARKSQAEAWLIDHAVAVYGEYKLADRFVDHENDAVDFMLVGRGALYQYAIEKAV